AIVSPIGAGITAALDGVTVISAVSQRTVSSAHLSSTLQGVVATSSVVSLIQAGVTSTLDGVVGCASVNVAANTELTIALDGVAGSHTATSLIEAGVTV